jgi:DNA-binding MarR family transcriptional regulator
VTHDRGTPVPAAPADPPNQADDRRDPSDESLADSFWSVARRLRETSQETLAPWDITPAHLRALRMLKRHGTIRLSELSDHLHIAPRSTTEVVDALETRGLVRRRPDPGDRRATLVELTEHGAEVLDAVRAAARGTEAGRVFGRLSRADRAELARILGQLRELAGAAPARRRPAAQRGESTQNSLPSGSASTVQGTSGPWPMSAGAAPRSRSRVTSALGSSPR